MTIVILNSEVAVNPAHVADVAVDTRGNHVLVTMAVDAHTASPLRHLITE